MIWNWIEQLGMEIGPFIDVNIEKLREYCFQKETLSYLLEF